MVIAAVLCIIAYIKRSHMHFFTQEDIDNGLANYLKQYPKTREGSN